VVKTGAPKLKVKTVEAITDHITQTLPTADNEYCQPLSQHYLKALNLVFEHPPNVERLKKSTWFDVVEFCVDGINQYLDDHDGEPSGPVRSSSGLGTKHLSGSIARSGTPNSHTESRPGSVSRQNVEDLLQTLLSLVSTTSAPISGSFLIVMNSIVRFLQTQSTSVSQMHQLAFSVVNAVLSYSCTDQITFTQSIAQDIIPLVCRFWQGKSVSKDEMLNSVRDEMLIFLFAVHPHLERSILDDSSDDLLTLLEELVDVLKADYARRSERDQLQLDDLEMIDLGLEVRHASPFSLNAFRLRSHNTRAERNWGNLQAIGVLERLISCGHQHRKRAGRKDDQDMEVHPRKRQRVALSSDRLLNSLRSEDEKSRISALQALPFILQDFQLSATGLNEVIDQLHSCASDKRGSISSWALLSIARYLHSQLHYCKDSNHR
jgi:ataxia telangiectasia mutated family protein